MSFIYSCPDKWSVLNIIFNFFIFWDKSKIWNNKLVSKWLHEIFSYLLSETLNLFETCINILWGQYFVAAAGTGNTKAVLNADDGDWVIVVTAADVSGDAVTAVAIVQTPAPAASEVVSVSLPPEAGTLVDDGITTDWPAVTKAGDCGSHFWKWLWNSSLLSMM